MSELADKGLLALLMLAAGAVVRWLQQRPIKAARKRAETAAGEAQAAEQAAARATQRTEEARADAALAEQKARIEGMGDDALLADAAARVERDRAERAAGGVPERHRD